MTRRVRGIKSSRFVGGEHIPPLPHGGRTDAQHANQLKATREKDPQASHTYPSLAESHSSFGASDRGGSFGRHRDDRMYATTTTADGTDRRTAARQGCVRGASGVNSSTPDVRFSDRSSLRAEERKKEIHVRDVRGKSISLGRAYMYARTRARSVGRVRNTPDVPDAIRVRGHPRNYQKTEVIA